MPAPGAVPAGLAAACAVRAAGEADAVAGVRPSWVAAPASTAETAAVIRAAAGLGLAVVPRGTGTKLDWGYPPSRCDLVVDLTGLDKVIDHAAGDLTVTVEAGITLDRLARALTGARQRLALDPPASGVAAGDSALNGHAGGGPLIDRPSANGGTAGGFPAGGSPAGGAVAGGAVAGGTAAASTAAGGAIVGGAAVGGTIGGVLAAGVAGPLRLRYGSGRDLLIGITVVRADGTIARSGGRVVKNVAGYDLGKLFAGSRGTLGLITEATFRLHPLPAAAAYVTAEHASAIAAASALSAALAPPLGVVAAELDWPAADAPVRTGLLVEGTPSAVAGRAEVLAGLLAGAPAPARAASGSSARVSQAPPAWWGAGLSVAGGTLLRIAFWPGHLALVLAEVRAAAGATGLDPAVGGSAGAGVLRAALPERADPAAVGAFVSGLREALAAAGRGPDRSERFEPPRASVVVLRAPEAVRAVTDLFGPVPGLALMRAVKERFDPERLLAPGRFAGGI